MTATDLQPQEFRIEPADYHTDLEALRQVRETVFVVEQGVPIEEEWDADDPHSRHVLARDAQRRPIGSGRLTPDGKIGRLAVLPEWRDRGVGQTLLQALLDQARERGLPEVRLHAQVSAVGFYERTGFEPYGERFIEAGIEHQGMKRAIAPFPAVPRAPSDLPPSQPAQAFLGADEAADALCRIVPAARSLLRIYSRDLDPGLLGRREVLDALRNWVAGRREARVRILVQDPADALLKHHPLLVLTQRLSSHFEFRSPVEAQDLQYPSAYVTGDRGGFLFRPLGNRFEGEASPCAPALARELAELFDPVWERSRPCTEFRALGI